MLHRPAQGLRERWLIKPLVTPPFRTFQAYSACDPRRRVPPSQRPPSLLIPGLPHPRHPPNSGSGQAFQNGKGLATKLLAECEGGGDCSTEPPESS